jgi:protein-S-isoprenylcysteine O-methyltransferase Ste14
VTPAPVVARLGGWLFRQRTWLPVPLAAALILIPPTPAGSSVPFWIAGLSLVAAGEGLRLWSVHHIGAISRTRSDRLGPLVAAGPFALVRNPLYIGNIALWAGFAVTAQLLWLTPAIILLLALEYHAIVRWEEQLLAARLGGAYRDYARRVRRWLPVFPSAPSTPAMSSLPGPGPATFSWRQTLFSERGTLIAIAAGIVVLLLKRRM